MPLSSPLDDAEALRILVVRIGAMGDVLHAMPAVAGLRKMLPACRIGWAVEPVWLPLLKSSSGACPLVDQVHVVPTRAWRQNLLKPATYNGIRLLRNHLRTQQYDVCVDLQGSLKSAITGRLAHAPRFVGLEHPREDLARILYTERVHVRSTSVIVQACELLSAAASTRIAPAKVEIPMDDPAESWCDQALAETTGSGFVYLVPTAGWAAKEWGAAPYIELARRLLAAGFTVLINQPAGTQAQSAQQIAAASGAISIPCTIAQMSALTRRAGLVVGGDTGPVHLAAALGRPTLALFGPTDPARNGPHFPGAQVRILRHSDSITSLKRRDASDRGLARITVEEVFDACLELLS